VPVEEEHVTPDDAKKVIDILLTVDGGCPPCVCNAVARFMISFPEHAQQAREALPADVLGIDDEIWQLQNPWPEDT
jgi:hypothetical protein